MRGKSEGVKKKAAWTIGTEEQYRWLNGIAKWILVFNLLDGVFTLVWVENSYDYEWNVMLRDLAHGDVLLFMLVKLTLVSLGTLFLWRNRNHPLAVISLFVAFFSYYLVFLYHVPYSTILFL